VNYYIAKSTVFSYIKAREIPIEKKVNIIRINIETPLNSSLTTPLTPHTLHIAFILLHPIEHIINSTGPYKIPVILINLSATISIVLSDIPIAKAPVKTTQIIALYVE
jgi:hypothetical protein